MQSTASPWEPAGACAYAVLAFGNSMPSTDTGDRTFTERVVAASLCVDWVNLFRGSLKLGNTRASSKAPYLSPSRTKRLQLGCEDVLLLSALHRRRHTLCVNSTHVPNLDRFIM